MISSRIEIIQKREDKLLVRLIKDSETWEHEYSLEKTFADLINDYTNGTSNEFPNEIIEYLKSHKNEEFSNERLIKDYINNYEEKNIILGDSSLKIPEMIGKPFSDPFCVFAFIKKEKILKILKFDGKDIYGLNDYGSYTAYCNGDDRLYISGGEKGKKYIEKFWKIDLKSLEIECIDMLPKKNHSMIVIPGNYVFIVGGQDKETFYYDHENSRFFGWKPLNRNRTEPALILVDTYLYCFDNVYSKEYENEFTFEKTNLNSENHEWELIKANMGNPLTKMNQKFFGVLKKDDDILFIGGNMDYDEDKEKDGNNAYKNYKCNLINNQIEESDLPFKEYNLKEKTFLPYSNNIYYIFPDFNRNHPEVIFYRKDRNQIKLVKYEAQEEPDVPPAKIDKFNFNQPKLEDNLNNLDLNIHPINTENDNNKCINSEIKNEPSIHEISGNINNNINNNLNDNLNNKKSNEFNNIINNADENNIVNNNKEEIININNNNPENDESKKEAENAFSKVNIFIEEDKKTQIVISQNELANTILVNNNSCININGTNTNINLNQNNNQNSNINPNIQNKQNNLNIGINDEKKDEEEKIEENSQNMNNNTPTEKLEILNDMIKSSNMVEKKESENQENIINTPQIIINDDNQKESQNIGIDINIPNNNFPQLDINLQGSKKTESQNDINVNLEKKDEEQNINVIKKESEEFCIKGVIKGRKKNIKEEKKENPKEEIKEEKNDGIDFILKGMILGKNEKDTKIIKYYNEKYKNQEKEKENNEQNIININAQSNLENLNTNNKIIENPFKSKIELNGNINPNPSNIELALNPPELNTNLNQNIELEKSNKININIDSKTPEIIGTDVKTPNLISGGINENIIQPFDINVQKQNLEIKVNNDNQENDDDYFKLTGVIKGTKDSNFKKENIINKTEENIRAPKIDINGNVVGGDINPSQNEIEKQNNVIENGINLNSQNIVNIKVEENSKENENNKNETKDFFCAKGFIMSTKNKNKNKVNEQPNSNFEGKIEISKNNGNMQSENVAINGQKIDNE